MNTSDLENKKIWIHRNTKKNPDGIKKLGRIHAFVFHPERPKFVGILVKRPDIAWMFRREDSFVAYNGFDILEDDKGKDILVVKDSADAIGKGALKAQNVKLDDCLLWLGLAVTCEDGTGMGVIDSVEYDPVTGDVIEMAISQGATANALLGKRIVPSEMIKGFKLGAGSKLNMPQGIGEDEVRGALILDNEAKELPVVGGVAENAGNATAVVIDKVQKTSSKVKEKVSPALNEAGEAVQKGAFVTGRQIARTEGMFKGFKDEFKKAMSDDE